MSQKKKKKEEEEEKEEEKPKKKKKCRGAGTSAPELAGSYLEVWPPGVCKQLTLFYLFLAVIRGS